MSTDAMPSSATLARLDVVTGNDSELLRSLLEASLRSLPQMYRPDVREFAQTVRPDPVRPGELRQEGVNERYAAIVGLGAAHLDDDQQRTLLAGITAADLVDSVAVRAARNADLGAVALAAWASAEVRRSAPPALVDRLAHAVRAARMQDTVSYAWTLTALLATADLADVSGLAEQTAERLLAAQEASGVFPHALPKETLGRFRSHVACFADQVYPIQALARYWRATGDRRALDAANRCAARIVDRQGSAGQWWWHYDVRTGAVVEGYPVYSVHQHAMAPMALFELQEAGGDDHRAAARGSALAAGPSGDGRRAAGRGDRRDLAEGGQARAPQARPVRPGGGNGRVATCPARAARPAPVRRRWWTTSAARTSWDGCSTHGCRPGPTGIGAASRPVGRGGRVTMRPDYRPDSRVLFGLPITACSMDDVVARRRCRPIPAADAVGVVNAAKIVKLRRDELLRTSLLDCDVILADGQSVVWASRLLGRQLPERVTGIDLFERLLELADRDHLRIYLLGARPEVLESVQAPHPGAVPRGPHRRCGRRLLRHGRCGRRRGGHPRIPRGHAVPGDDDAEEGDLPRAVRGRARRPGAARCRRLLRRPRRCDEACAVGLAAARHGVAVPPAPGATAPGPALRRHQQRVHRPDAEGASHADAGVHGFARSRGARVHAPGAGGPGSPGGRP